MMPTALVQSTQRRGLGCGLLPTPDYVGNPIGDTMANFLSAAGAASDDHLPTLPLRRVPMKGKIQGVLTTRDIRELWTHYFRGRTVGCSRPHCPGCSQGSSKRYEGYVGLYNQSTKFHAIFGLTIGAVRQILDQVGRLDNIRGLMLTMYRRGSKSNARVVVETSAIVSDCSALPAPFDVLEHLKRIWGTEYLADIAEIERARSAGGTEHDIHHAIALGESYSRSIGGIIEPIPPQEGSDFPDAAPH